MSDVAPVSNNFPLDASQAVDLAVSYKDAYGNTAQAPAGVTLTATSSDDAVATASAVDQNTVRVTTVGPVGTVTVTVTDGTLSGTFTTDVVAAAAAAITLTPGTPVAR